MCAEKSRASDSVLRHNIQLSVGGVSTFILTQFRSYTSDQCFNVIHIAQGSFFKDGMKRRHGNRLPKLGTMPKFISVWLKYSVIVAELPFSIDRGASQS